MELNLLKTRESPLLNRKRVTYMINFGGGATPSIIDFRDAVAIELKIKKELISIRHVYQRYGFSKAKVIAHIYNTRKDLLNLEKIKKAEKKEVEAEKKAVEEAKKKAEAKEEVKAEAKAEVKEEAKEEAKEEVKAEAKAEEKEEAKEEVKAEAKEEVKAEAKVEEKVEDGKEASKE